MAHTILTAHDAYWFLQHHPKSVEINPDHPVIDTTEYAHEGWGVVGSDERFGGRDGKPRDAEYVRAWREHATLTHWEGQFINNLDIVYIKVNAKTLRYQKNRANTRVRVWLETGPAYWDEYTKQYQPNMHDPALDSDGDTFEEALISLAGKVMEKYGDYDDV